MSDGNMKAPGMRRGVRILLFASLAVNLLVAGLVIGAMVSHRFDGHGKRPRFSQAGGPLTAALTREDRRAVGRNVRKTLRAERPSKETIMEEFSNVIRALKQSPYEPQAVRAAVERQMQYMVRRADLSVEALLTRLNEMSAEERAAYAGRLQEVLERGPRKKRKD